MPDPFALFDLPRGFAVDLSELQRRYLQRSAETHPDRFTDPLEQADAADRAAELNDALKRLTDPERRARLLLELAGQEISSDEQTLPPAMLMEVMEVREALDQAVEQNDTAELERLHRWVQQQRDEYLQQLASLFEAPSLDAAAVQRQLNGLRYIERMREQMPEGSGA